MLQLEENSVATITGSGFCGAMVSFMRVLQKESTGVSLVIGICVLLNVADKVVPHTPTETFSIFLN